MKRGLLIGLGVVIAVIVGAVYFLYSSLDGLVKTAVEKGGSEVTRVPVTLDSAKIGLTEGTGSLNGLTVGNPSGFKTDSAFRLGQVSVKIDTATITSDPVVIKEVIVAAPQVTYELGATSSNIDAIKRNVEAFAATHGGGQKSTSSGQGPKIIIENLYIRDGKVQVSAVPLGGKTLDASLPNIHLKDIGKESKGATPPEIAEKVIAALTSRTGSLVGRLDLSGVLEGVAQVPEALKGLAGGAAMQGVTEKAGELTKGITESAGGATGGAADAVKGVTESAAGALKGLLGGNK